MNVWRRHILTYSMDVLLSLSEDTYMECSVFHSRKLNSALWEEKLITIEKSCNAWNTVYYTKLQQSRLLVQVFIISAFKKKSKWAFNEGSVDCLEVSLKAEIKPRMSESPYGDGITKQNYCSLAFQTSQHLDFMVYIHIRKKRNIFSAPKLHEVGQYK